MSSHTRYLSALASTTFLMSSAGCVQRNVSGDTITYNLESWVPWLTFVVFSLIGLVGWHMWRNRCVSHRRNMHGISYMCVAVFFIVGVIPTYFTNYVVITPEELHTSTGFVWFLPHTHHVTFESLNSMTTENRFGTGRNASRLHEVLVFRPKSGPLEEEDVEQLLRAAKADIFAAAHAKGVKGD